MNESDKSLKIVAINITAKFHHFLRQTKAVIFANSCLVRSQLLYGSPVHVPAIELAEGGYILMLFDCCNWRHR